MYTVKQLSDLAGVSVRTLHHYDHIGLLKPTQVGANGYRYYDDAALLRLQQILFYREIGLELLQIKDILDAPDFDIVAALRAHRQYLQERARRLQHLIRTVDTTIMHLTGEMDVSKKRLFEGFTTEKQKEYERRARLQYGAAAVNDSIRRWNGYSKAEHEAIMAEGGDIYSALARAMQEGHDPTSAETQALLARWHDHLRHFYEPTTDILRGLGQLYNTDAEFIAFFQKLHPDLPPYLEASIVRYVDDWETAELERLLAEDAAQRGALE